MKLFSTFLICAVTLFHLKAQDYSKLISLGFDNEHIVQNYNFQNDQLDLLMAHLCDNNESCRTISSFSVGDGSLIKSKLILNFKGGNFHPYLKEENRTLVSGFTDDFKGVKIYELDSLINFKEEHLLFGDGEYMYNNGLIEHLGAYYLWGDVGLEPDDISVAYIIKLDSTLSTILGEWYYRIADKESHCYALQAQPDDNLAFMVRAKYNNTFGSNDSLHIVKIDTSGSIIHNHSFDRGPSSNKFTFTTLKNGDYIHQTNFEGPIGEITKVDQFTGEHLWQYQFPMQDDYSNKPYSTFDLKEMINGDILVCGGVKDILGDDDNPTLGLAGFLLRLTSDGELVWLKRIKVPNEYDIEDKSSFVLAHFASVEELDDGAILLLGEAKELRGNSAFQYLWMLKLDQKGCYKGNCSDTLTVDQQFNEAPPFEIGATWNYGAYDESTKRVSSKEFVITDTTMWEGRNAYIVEPGVGGPRDYMYEDNGEVYFWDIGIQDYQLHYNFNAVDQYTTRIFDRSTEQFRAVVIHIDSTTTRTIQGVDHEIQHVTTQLGFNTDEVSFEIVKGIGRLDNEGLRLYLGLEPDNFFNQTQELRCFSNDTIDYKFVDYDCDEVWFISNTDNVLYDEVSISPNPSQGSIHIEGLDKDVTYQLLNAEGKLVQEGTSKNHNVNIDPSSGVYFLKFQYKEQLVTRRVVIIQ